MIAHLVEKLRREGLPLAEAVRAALGQLRGNEAVLVDGPHASRACW